MERLRVWMMDGLSMNHEVDREGRQCMPCSHSPFTALLLSTGNQGPLPEQKSHPAAARPTNQTAFLSAACQK
jgi:hypothetical protein